MDKLPEATVHGRFQPPLHRNHWEYIKQGFLLANHVTVLITNPDLSEAFDETASWRNDPVNNPFTYSERVQMFGQFFSRMGIGVDTYSFRKFDIKNEASFSQLAPDVPNIVNVYSPWSAKKAATFLQHGLTVVRLEQPKLQPVSGTRIREIIMSNVSKPALPEELVSAGFMPEAVPGLLEVLASREQ